jgi:ribonuclease VapC
VIVVDASALVAIGDEEAEADRFLEALEASSGALLSPINAVEAALILIGRGRLAHAAHFEAWLASLGITVDDAPQTYLEALGAYLRFGRGYHPARLNLGHSFAYALAERLEVPLLYKGDDFPKTDIRSALQPT